MTGDSKRGTVLLGVLIVLLTISLIGATLASLFLSVTAMAEVELERAQALYLAEAGVAQVLHQLRQAGASGLAVGISEQVQSASLGEGEYEVRNDPVTAVVTSVGKVRGVRRTIQVRYQPL